MSFRDQLPRRLQKLLADGTSLSRRELREAIGAGRVRVGGRVATDPDRWVFGDDDVTVDGRAVRPRREQHTVLFHKPAAVTTTLADTLGRDDLSGPLEGMPAGCAPVGRLDRATTGALLFTTDGDLLNAVLRPEHHVPKVYRLTLAEAVTAGDPRLAQLVAGVPTALGELSADDVRIGERRPGRAVVNGPPDRGTTELWLTLREGKNRQIRRMCRRAGLRLRALHRVSVGPIALGELPEGQWRSLTEGEVDALWSAVGGRALVRAQQRSALERQAQQLRDRGEPNERLEAWLAQG